MHGKIGWDDRHGHFCEVVLEQTAPPVPVLRFATFCNVAVVSNAPHARVARIRITYLPLVTESPQYWHDRVRELSLSELVSRAHALERAWHGRRFGAECCFAGIYSALPAQPCSVAHCIESTHLRAEASA